MIPRPTRRKACATTLLVAMVLVSLRGASAEPVDEYRLKAALIYNLAKFVEWPDTAFTEATAPLAFCVIGRDPFGAGLEEMVQGHHIKGHSMAVKHVVDAAPTCHVIFVADSEFKRLPAIIERVRDLQMLTVSEAPNFLEQGGMVRLVNRDDQVRFEVNLSATDRAHVKISAHVLALAASARRYDR